MCGDAVRSGVVWSLNFRLAHSVPGQTWPLCCLRGLTVLKQMRRQWGISEWVESCFWTGLMRLPSHGRWRLPTRGCPSFPCSGTSRGASLSSDLGAASFARLCGDSGLPSSFYPEFSGWYPMLAPNKLLFPELALVFLGRCHVFASAVSTPSGSLMHGPADTLSWIHCIVGSWCAHCGMFSSVPGLYLLNTSSDQNCPWTSLHVPWMANCT